jgi:PAS domain S-box-containing protein
MNWPGPHHSGASLPTEVGMSVSHRHRLWLSLVVAAGGITVSFLFFGLLRGQERDLAESQFRHDAEKRMDAVQHALNDRLNTVGTLARYFASSELVERREFHTFVTPLLTRHLGIDALGWAPRIKAGQREAHERFVRREGLAKYEITEQNGRGETVLAAIRADYFPILFIEPADKNRPSLGIDIQSNPRYRLATQRAIATRQMVADAWTESENGSAAQALLLVVAPAKNEVPSAADRPDDQPGGDGFAFGLFRLGDLVESTIQPFPPLGIDMSIVARAAAGGERLVYNHFSRLHVCEAAEATGQSVADLRFSREIEVADGRWKADCTPVASYCAQYHTLGPVAVLVAGLLITSLLVGFLFLLIGRTARVEQLAARRMRELQESERKFSAILDQTYQFIGLISPEGIVLEANQSALEFSGISVADVRNKLFWETPWWSHSAELQQKLREGVKRAARGEFVRMEATHVAEDGEVRWIDFSLKPVKDENGKVIFVIPEGRDITVRKHIEEALGKEQQLLRNLLDLHEQDRKLTAYEIHDGLAQQLAGALYKFQSIDALRDHDPEAAREVFDESVGLLREAMAETRRLISGLRPPILDESGVIDAIEYLVSERNARGGPEIEFVHPGELGRLAAPLESAIFRIVQECLTNACRYSQSDKVRVEVRQSDGRAHIEVRDWGVGFDPAGVEQGHYGLRGIRERARLLGGSASIDSAPGKGVCISVNLPLLPPLENGAAKRGDESVSHFD